MNESLNISIMFNLFLGLGIIAQMIWYSIQTQILINKIMSRNYSDYEMSKPEQPQAPKQQEESLELPPRDLGYLSGFNR